MKITSLSLTLLLVVASGIDVICAQFKVINMNSSRSLASSHERSAAALHGKGKLLRDSNVTVIQVLPRERFNRRANKVIRRRVEPLVATASDLDVLTLTPVSRERSDGNLMKLHIINVRTGKIQDAIVLTTANDNDVGGFAKARKSDTSSRGGEKEIIRVHPLHSSKPESPWNELNINANGNGKNRYPLKPYKLRNKFTSSKCKCEDTSRMWNCKKIQISIAQCKSNQFMCCSSATS